MSSKILPKNTDEFYKYLKQLSPSDFLPLFQDENESCSSLLAPLKYSVPALITGRPLGSAVVFVTGIPSSGKSTTIHSLFDFKLKTTTTIKTTEPVQISKDLLIQHEGSCLTGSLHFVDAPGFLECTESNGAINLANIRAIKEAITEIQERNQVDEEIAKNIDVRKEVYPNIVLFVIQASENRILEKNSILRKSLSFLKEIPNLVDVKKQNLIIILTNCLALGTAPARFTEKLEEKIGFIQKVVQEIFEFNSPVIPLENHGEDYDLVKENGYSLLPDGKISHKNLLDGMINMCANNGDLQGKTFFDKFANEPNRSIGAAYKKLEFALTRRTLVEAYQSISGTTTEEFVDALDTKYLGRGYCPVRERVMTHTLLVPNSLSDDDIPSELKFVEIDGKKWFIPTCVKAISRNSSRIVRHTCWDRMEYSRRTKQMYGFEDSLNLNIDGDSAGRWVTKMDRTLGLIGGLYVTFLQEFHIATLTIQDPVENFACISLLKDIENLPHYDINTQYRYKKFFNKWGTHFVYEVGLGGYLRLKLRISDFDWLKDPKRLEEICAAASNYIAKQWEASGNQFPNQDMRNSLNHLGVLEIYPFEFIGGIKETGGKDLRIWKQSLADAPIELQQTIGLLPYYNLINDHQKAFDLEVATKDFLSGLIKINQSLLQSSK